ncbi:MAG: inositol monophosphatase [Chitinispirillaceae bacterium]|nr:inositol monophosphatase [Chitinispirillaceae bacterium]
MMKDIRELAAEAARRAGDLLISMFGKAGIMEKGAPHNLVTEADCRAEEQIVGFLDREAPGSSFYGEESLDKACLDAERLWIIDPLDGTTNYAQNIPHFGVSIAYADRGILLAGVVYDPLRRELFSASAGKGALCNGAPANVSRKSRLNESLIATGFYYDRGVTMEKTLAALHALFRADIRCMRRMGSASLDLAWLACGRYDAYFEYTLSAWDFAAGLLIVREAGGLADNIDGTPADLQAKGLLCSNGLVHDAFLKRVLDPGKRTVR